MLSAVFLDKINLLNWTDIFYASSAKIKRLYIVFPLSSIILACLKYQYQQSWILQTDCAIDKETIRIKRGSSSSALRIFIQLLFIWMKKINEL